MLLELKEAVCAANLDLVKEGLVVQTFGNVSGLDRSKGLAVIKPSGVSYDVMKPEHMVVVSVEDGKVIEGSLRPSSDTATHLELYRCFPSVNGIVHTHSIAATAWAQASREIPCFGTTHADYFYGAVPCTRRMSREEIESSYELNTGKLIVQTFHGKNPLHFPGVLVANHGPFAWGTDARDAVHNAAILEYLAQLATQTININPSAGTIAQELIDKHFLRKHGPGKYYGQG